MAVASLCPACRAPLPGDAPEGLCPRCLLQRGLSSPVVSPLAPGWTPPTPAELAPHFPQLEIVELLGQGGMGAVYKARQLKLDRMVALKVLPPLTGRDPAFTERFAREARALARLSHPNIVGIHDFGEAGGYFYFLMEHVDGFNLRQWLWAGQLKQPGALDIIPQVCEALQYAHEQGIVHRDIKPENILLTRRGQVKIADFGLAKLLGPATGDYKLTATNQVMGTPHYMAPEQLERPAAVDHRADIYSLGVVFYEMIAGELPLGRFAPPSHKAPVDARLDGIILKALEKDLTLRYARIGELRADIEALKDWRAACPPAAATSVSDPRFQQEIDQELLRMKVRAPASGLICAALGAAMIWAIIGVNMLTTGQRRYEDDVSYFYRNIAGTRLVQQPGRSYLTEIESRRFENYVYPVLIGAPLVIVAAWFLIVGARRMKRFEEYDSAVMASIWAMIPWNFGLGLPFGIWALVVLRRPEVRIVFLRKAVQQRLGLPPDQLPAGPLPECANPPTGFVWRKLRSAYGAVRTLLIGGRVEDGR